MRHAWGPGFVSLFVVACGSPPAPPATVAPGPPAPASASASDPASQLAAVADVHGGAGPWAVAGYRMGAYALKRFGLARYSFDLDVEHHSPHAVQFSCVADGAAAATGASVGKLNLRLVDADEAHLATTFRQKSTGATVTLRPTADFAARFKDVPRGGLADAGRAVIALPDAAIFEEVR